MFSMKKIPWVTCFVAVCIIAFASGIVTGFIKTKMQSFQTPSEEEKEAVQSVLEEEETLFYSPVEEVKDYVVISKGDYIILTEVTDSSETVVEIIEINKSVLPGEDVALLEKGISFSDKNEALMMIENFVS